MEEADALIDDLSRDKDPNLRICGMYTIAMAYCGTGNNKAIKQLLHVAVRSCLIKYCIYTCTVYTYLLAIGRIASSFGSRSLGATLSHFL